MRNSSTTDGISQITFAVCLPTDGDQDFAVDILDVNRMSSSQAQFDYQLRRMNRHWYQIDFFCRSESVRQLCAVLAARVHASRTEDPLVWASGIGMWIKLGRGSAPAVSDEQDPCKS